MCSYSNTSAASSVSDVKDESGGTLATFFVMFEHGLNTLICVVDSLVAQEPVRFWHFWWASAYGLAYLVFSAAYQGLGGTGHCRYENITYRVLYRILSELLWLMH